MAETPMRNVRVATDIWEAAQRRARNDGTNVSELVRDWLKEYAHGARGVDAMIRAALTLYADEVGDVRDELEAIAARLTDIRSRLLSGD